MAIEIVDFPIKNGDFPLLLVHKKGKLKKHKTWGIVPSNMVIRTIQNAKFTWLNMIYKIGIGASKDLDFNTRNGDLTVRNRDWTYH